jgi:hypothetical protein
MHPTVTASLLVFFGQLMPLHSHAQTSQQATTFVPANDNVVVQRLTHKPTPSERQRQRQLRADPANLPLALATARDAIARARQLGDPRDLGLAQTALQPWWTDTNAPAAAVLLRATVLQSQHHFDAALRDLGTLLDPKRPIERTVSHQARLTRAAILQAQGQLAAAQSDCAALEASSRQDTFTNTRTLARACLAELQSLQGQNQTATRAFEALAQNSPASPWLSLLRAEHAERLGARADAAKHFIQATQGTPDIYAVSAYVDWLLNQGQTAQALTLLNSLQADPDALLLRRAIALKRLNDPSAAQQASVLRARFSEARRPSDASRDVNAATTLAPSLHAREEARFALDVDGDASRAWALAQSNWAEQKEPADAVLYVRAAVAAHAMDAAKALVASLKASGWHDVRLAQALQRKP